MDSYLEIAGGYLIVCSILRGEVGEGAERKDGYAGDNCRKNRNLLLDIHILCLSFLIYLLFAAFVPLLTCAATPAAFAARATLVRWRDY